MSEGEVGEEMIFIESGEAEVTVTKGEISTVVAKVEKGNVVGEGALFDSDSRRSANVIAKSKTVRGRSLLYKDFHSIVGQGAERFLQDLFLAKILTGIKTFKSMSTDQIDALCASATTKHYAKGEDMVKEGDLGNELFIVIRGKVSFFKQLPTVKAAALWRLSLDRFFWFSVW